MMTFGRGACVQTADRTVIGGRAFITGADHALPTGLAILEVRTLAREELVAAVTGNPESVERAEEVVSTRLQTG